MEQKLLTLVYEKYHRELYLYIYSLSRNHHIAEDLTQETFLKALLSLPEEHGNIRAWLYMVARNLFFNYRKKASRNVSLEEEMKRSDEEKDLLANMIENERKLQLYQALKKLDMKKREILLLQYFGDLSQKEIAAVLHITPENVRVLAYRAKKELKKYMEQQGG
ncbi:RNA polymerase sigma factor [Blautia schinkii]|uniref:RNA polymerase sigma factor n=1 Tax=Blautia schinkii TaxID=180164 RepID=UPI00156F34B6|nr:MULTISPECIES: RNA polymerase sigma factor [Clostridia]NSG82356.1 RNA polymerase sigma factor [Blautia schinkii]NSK22959.1 RNA polymerase sigma factor [Blautia schinkii]NSK25999.1 RNA polymerase sigma factor [Blautia schinkii]NSK32009.1 RNA polymerase sigma factor [Blautia schinkii]NSK48256.1 RNA polymerase sigma factor [Blautia schinkii]